MEDSSHNPIAGATVELYSDNKIRFSTISDSSGNFSIGVSPDVPTQTYLISAKGFVSKIVHIHIESKAAPLNVELHKSK